MTPLNKRGCPCFVYKRYLLRVSTMCEEWIEYYLPRACPISLAYTLTCLSTRPPGIEKKLRVRV